MGIAPRSRITVPIPDPAKFGSGLVNLYREPQLPELLKAFTTALDEDLNVSGAWGAVFKWVHETNRKLAENALSPAQAAAALAAWQAVDSVLGVGTVAEAGLRRCEARIGRQRRGAEALAQLGEEAVIFQPGSAARLANVALQVAPDMSVADCFT